MKLLHFSALIIISLFVIQGIFGQCFPDRHSTNWFDGWISCETKDNPNTDHQTSHWILYNFGQPYTLSATKLWNTNDPQNLDAGLRTFIVDYSNDGSSWTSLGTFALAQADGQSTYEGSDGADFGGVRAQYVLITAVDNYGADCFGLSEVRFETTDVVTSGTTTPSEESEFCMSLKVYPNPFLENPRLDIQSNCQTPVDYTITDALGHTIYQASHQADIDISEDLPLDGLLPGMYYLEVNYGGNRVKIKKLIKME